MSGRRWVLLIPAPCEWLTSNKQRRMHFHAQRKAIKAWRDRTYLAAHAAHLPKDLDRVRIEPVALIYGNAVVRDAHNLNPTLKAAVDGLGPRRVVGDSVANGYHLVPDDSDEHVELTAIRIERLPAHPYRLGSLQLTITDLSEDI